MMRWVQDFSRCSRHPTIDDFVTVNDFKQALSTAAQRASLHKVDTDQVDMTARQLTRGSSKTKGSGQSGTPLSSTTSLPFPGSTVCSYRILFEITRLQITHVILQVTSRMRSSLAHPWMVPSFERTLARSTNSL